VFSSAIGTEAPGTPLRRDRPFKDNAIRREGTGKWTFPGNSPAGCGPFEFPGLIVKA
jgi:hypothetical protein